MSYTASEVSDPGGSAMQNHVTRSEQIDENQNITSNPVPVDFECNDLVTRAITNMMCEDHEVTLNRAKLLCSDLLTDAVDRIEITRQLNRDGDLELGIRNMFVLWVRKCRNTTYYELTNILGEHERNLKVKLLRPEIMASMRKLSQCGQSNVMCSIENVEPLPTPPEQQPLLGASQQRDTNDTIPEGALGQNRINQVNQQVIPPGDHEEVDIPPGDHEEVDIPPGDHEEVDIPPEDPQSSYHWSTRKCVCLILFIFACISLPSVGLWKYTDYISKRYHQGEHPTVIVVSNFSQTENSSAIIIPVTELPKITVQPTTLKSRNKSSGHPAKYEEDYQVFNLWDPLGFTNSLFPYECHQDKSQYFNITAKSTHRWTLLQPPLTCSIENVHGLELSGDINPESLLHLLTMFPNLRYLKFNSLSIYWTNDPGICSRNQGIIRLDHLQELVIYDGQLQCEFLLSLVMPELQILTFENTRINNEIVRNFVRDLILKTLRTTESLAQLNFSLVNVGVQKLMNQTICDEISHISSRARAEIINVRLPLPENVNYQLLKTNIMEFVGCANNASYKYKYVN